jgi:hypothetical protein
MPVESEVDGAVDAVDNRTRAIQLRTQGLTMAKIGEQLGISAQGVHKLLKTAPKTSPSNLPLVKIEAASRTLAELAESTRAALAETFQIGARRAQRRIREVEASNDDAAAKTVLETAKLATEGAAKIHGWADTNAGGSSGRISIGLVADLRGLKSAQVVDVEPVPTDSGVGDDSSNHPNPPKQAENNTTPS